jgi:hypothetical protein
VGTTGEAIERKEIGSRYFASFPRSSYYEILNGLATSPCVIDGIRLAEGVERLKASHDVLHIHCYIGDDIFGHSAPPTEPYREELPKLAVMADLLLRRKESIPNLGIRLQQLVYVLQALSDDPRHR